MPLPQLLFFLLSPLLIILLIHFITTRQYRTASTTNKLPPSPPALPVIGHLHRLGSLPHRSLQKISSKYGSIILLHLGRVPTVILSSASVVQEAIRNHDLALSNRPHYINADILTYGSSSVPFTQYGEHWRQARRIYAVHMLSVKQVESFRQLHREEVALFVDRIRSDGASGEKAINLSKLLIDLTNGIACRATFGEKYPLEAGTSIEKLSREVAELMLEARIGEFIPWLSWIDRLRSIDKRAKTTAEIFDRFLEGVIQKHLQKRKNNVFQDMILAGTDTVYVAMEWVMAELIKHPVEMERVQQEVRRIVHTCGELNEDSIGKMSFLKAVIYETLRLHPPVPILFPRETTKEIQLLSYRIPSKTRVIINAWAIGRDPECWGSRAFGVGRRGCPGINLASRIVELVLANLLYNFDWKLHDETNAESLDMTESSGLSVHLKNNLVLVAKPFLSSDDKEC